jgi:uncharacterized protein
MEDDQLIFGLAKRHYQEMIRIFSKYPHVERALIFGSRAKGSEKPYSDIDLAVVAPEMDQGEFSRLLEDLESLDLVFKLDVVHLDQLNQPKLRESIMTHGKTFYPL